MMMIASPSLQSCTSYAQLGIAVADTFRRFIRRFPIGMMVVTVRLIDRLSIVILVQLDGVAVLL